MVNIRIIIESMQNLLLEIKRMKAFAEVLELLNLLKKLISFNLIARKLCTILRDSKAFQNSCYFG